MLPAVKLENNPALPPHSQPNPAGWLSSWGASLSATYTSLFGSATATALVPKGKAMIATTVSTFADEVKTIRLLFGNPAGPQDPKAILAQFCNDIINRSRGSIQSTNVARDHFYLGALILLADRNLNDAAQLIDSNDLQKSFQNIEKSLDTAMNQIKTDLNDYQLRQKQAGIQDPDLALSINKPETIAQTLITSVGTFNCGLIDYVIKNFVQDASRPPYPYEKDIATVLTQFAATPSLKTALTSIVKPESETSSANDIIRVTLDLHPDEKVTDVHAKQTALAALLSHLRQGPVGSCFATYLGIELLQQRIDKCLQDFAEILRWGKATRHVDGAARNFFYRLTIADDAINAPFYINREGKIKGTTVPVWEAPGIHFALLQLGITDGSKISLDVIQSLFSKTRNECVEITPARWIGFIANQLWEKNNRLTIDDKNYLINRANFAFSAETNNPLLRVWESLLAAMAEGSPKDFVRGKIIQCVSKSFNIIYQSLLSAKIRKELMDVKTRIEASLNERVQLIFDANIPLKNVTSDGSSTSGGFVLQGVDNPHAFIQFVDDTLTAAQKSFSAKETTQINTINKIRDFVHKDNTFLKMSLRNYDDSNKKIQDPVSNWETLDHLPWRDETGDDNRETFAVELGSVLPNPITLHPKDAEELLLGFLNFAKNVQNLKGNLAPSDTPSHAFGLTIKDPHVQKWMESGQDATAWMNFSLVNPAKSALAKPIDDQTKSRLNTYVVTYILPTSVGGEYLKQVNAFKTQLSIVDYSNQVLDLISKLVVLSKELKEAISRQISGYLLDKGMSQEVRQGFYERSVQIADTNWNRGIHDIGFRITMDPINEVPLLVIQNEDNSGLEVMDPGEWLQEWDFFSVNTAA